MKSQNVGVRTIILGNKTPQLLINELSFLTGIPADDLMPPIRRDQDAHYEYIPGNHRIILFNHTDRNDGWYAMLNVYNRPNPDKVQIPDKCGECGSELTFFTNDHIHCYECGAETPWP